MFAPAKSGAIPIVPGKPENSEVIARIGHADPDERMPPEGDALEPEEIETLKEWIASGAEWQEHWAFVPRNPGIRPRNKNTIWPVNGIDHYVLANLETARIEPSPEAARYTLIRRVALDLTGLPPGLIEVDAFVADKSPNAYEKIVDHYLASPHFGGAPFIKGVLKIPGAMVFILIPILARSLAIGKVIPTTPPLLAL